MPQYAIHEVRSLLGGLPTPLDDRSPVVRYVCALFAELAYYHIPQWEIDDKKRAKLSSMRCLPGAGGAWRAYEHRHDSAAT